MRSLVFIAGMCMATTSFAQIASTTGGAAIPFTGNATQPTYLTGLFSQPLKNLFENRNILGSPYLSPEYKPGLVKIKNGYTQNNVPVRFNLYTNEIEFKLNNSEQSLDSVDMVLYLDKPGDSSSLKLFKSGYPSISSNKETTIYEVLAMGERIHLLKHTMQKIEERKVMGMPNEKYLETFSTLYFFNVEKKSIVKIKNPQKQILEMFPDLSSTIEKTIREKNLNVKQELALAELVTVLNNLPSTKASF